MSLNMVELIERDLGNDWLTEEGEVAAQAWSVWKYLSSQAA